MTTNAQRLAKLEREKRIMKSGARFAGMYDIHSRLSWESAGDWTATHVGMLHERIDELERKVKRLEMKTK